MLIPLVLSAFGCSPDGGVGIAGFGTPPLDPGIYSGNVECVFVVALQSGTTSSFSTGELIIPIASSGFPDFAGSKPTIGSVGEFNLGFLIGTSTVTNVGTDTGKVFIGTSVEAVAFFENRPSSIVAGFGSALYEQRVDGGIDYTLDLFLGTSDAAESLSWNCAGVLSR